jgi:hypothetical protein
MDALIIVIALFAILALAALAGAAESRDGFGRGDHSHSVGH